MGYDVERTKKIQNIVLEIMKSIHKICVNNNLTYYLCAGSVLGAVRHNGFIPWDDDLDIVMPREDYEKFLKLAPSVLPKSLYLQTPYSEKLTPCLFAKVRIKKTLFEEEINKGLDYPKGLFVDIFPLDNVKRISKTFRLKFKLVNFYKHIFIFKTRSDKLSFKKKMFKVLSKIYSRKYVYNKIKKLMIINKKTDYVIETYSTYKFDHIVFKSSVFGTPILHVFEDTEFYIPENYDEYLKTMYGDYMKLPPIEKRGIQHSIIKVDFNYDDSKYFSKEN